MEPQRAGSERLMNTLDATKELFTQHLLFFIATFFAFTHTQNEN